MPLATASILLVVSRVPDVIDVSVGEGGVTKPSAVAPSEWLGSEVVRRFKLDGVICELVVALRQRVLL